MFCGFLTHVCVKLTKTACYFVFCQDDLRHQQPLPAVRRQAPDPARAVEVRRPHPVRPGSRVSGSPLRPRRLQVVTTFSASLCAARWLSACLTVKRLWVQIQPVFFYFFMYLSFALENSALLCVNWIWRITICEGTYSGHSSGGSQAGNWEMTQSLTDCTKRQNI